MGRSAETRTGARRPLGTLFSSLAVAAVSPGLRRLTLAFGGSMAVDWAFTVALAVFAYRQGGTAAVGIAGFLRLLPPAVLTPFASALADRHRRERVLTAVGVISAAALAVAAAAGWLGAGLAAVLVVAAVQAMAATLFRPVSLTLMPSLAETPEQVIAGNAAFAIVEGLGTCAGPVAAGVLVALESPAAAFAACAAVYAAVAATTATIRVEGRIDTVPAPVSVRTGLLAGFRELRQAELRLVIGLFVAQSAVRGALNVLIVVAVFGLLHASSGWVGFLTAAVGAGGVLGGAAAASFAGRRLAAPFAGGLLLWGVPIALLAAMPHRVPALLLLGAVGIGNAAEDVSGLTLIQRLVSDDVLGRVQGVLIGLATAAAGLGAIVAPGLVSTLGSRGAFYATGAVMPLLVLVSWLRLRRTDERAAAPVRELARLQLVPMFAPLPVAAKEHVAMRFVPLQVPAGREVVAQGEQADHFYVIGDGKVEITRDGRHIAYLGAGGYFGEIALLRDTPRTATATALEPSTVFGLEREDFLAAVTGHPRSPAAGEEVVVERLASYEFE